MKKKDLEGMAEEISQMMKEGGSRDREMYCMAGNSHHAKECNQGHQSDFSCSHGGLMAFGCTGSGEWDCSNSSFKCQGGFADDFECASSGFQCNREFQCSYSFDEEDCEDGGGSFECKEDDNFKCSFISYTI